MEKVLPSGQDFLQAGILPTKKLPRFQPEQELNSVYFMMKDSLAATPPSKYMVTVYSPVGTPP